MKRKVGGREQNVAFFIVCEGEKTEPNYFEGFNLPSRRILRPLGAGKNTASLVDWAIKQKHLAGEGYEHYWCVFDRDSFPAQNFNNALQKSEIAGFKVAYTNEAFELWYLLHFDFYTSASSRKDYALKLTERLGRKYEKNDPSMYQSLRERTQTAIRNARRLLESYNPHIPERDNPCTPVHLLVELLLAEMEKDTST